MSEWGMRTALFLLGMCVSPPASAEATTVQFLTEYESASEDGQRYLESFLKGVVAAYMWTNITLKSEGEPQLFCLNAYGGQQLEDPIQVLRFAAKNQPQTRILPVGMAMLFTLKRRWPCAKPEPKSGDPSDPLDLMPPQTE